MFRLMAIAIAVLGITGAAQAQQAQSYQCQKGSDTRSVTVERSADGCRVLYKKGASGEAKEIYRYKAHPETCQTQAQSFVKKLQGMGLTCSPG
ncbi:MAG TPA: hypothetical protein VMU06_11015 [Stellaceae bacterium]|nr:hypothetical protein [Stellaceae bacterium]